MAVYRDSAGVLRDDQGFTGGGAIDPNTAFKVVQQDEQNSANLDLSGNNAIIIPIGDGKGIIGVDVSGLSGSGATIVCEMQIGDTWKPSNMLVNGTGGSFTQQLTVDGQFRSSSAAKWNTRIRVSQPGTGTARIAWSLSTAASVIQLGAPLPPGTNAIGSMIVTSLPKVSFDGAQPVALPSGYTLPVTQSGSWTVNQAGTWTVAATQSGNWAISGNVSVSNFPTSFSVSNFPATQPVSGTVGINGTVPVSGTFWQATQPISAASLPLPAGAATLAGQNAIVSALAPQATAAKQDTIIAALGGRLTVNDYRLPNPDAAGAVTPKVTTNVSAYVASTSPCNFFGAVVIANTDGAGAYVFLLNRTTIPASGSTINMSEVLALTGYSTGGGASLVPDQVPDRYSLGCVLIVSTSITTYTPPTGTNLPRYIKVRVL